MSASDDPTLPHAPTAQAARLSDVAREAGVAIATVSRALSKPGRVNADTRERILAAAQRLGYSTNIAARSLRSGSSRIVLVIMPPWEGFSVLEGVLRGIDAGLTQAGYSMIVTALDRERAASPRILETARGGFVDGILAVTNEPRRDNGELPVLSARLPTVGVLVDLSSFGMPSIVVAEREGTRVLTRHLIDRGRRHLMYVGGLAGYHDIERIAGFEDALRTSPHPVTSLHMKGDYSASAGVQVAQAFLAMTERPDGVVFSNDMMAIAFMDLVRKAGVRIPEDVAVTGFDDIAAATYCEPALTTYRQPMEEMGAEATRLLLRMITGGEQPKAERSIFQGQVVIRGSSS